MQKASEKYLKNEAMQTRLNYFGQKCDSVVARATPFPAHHVPQQFMESSTIQI